MRINVVALFVAVVFGLSLRAAPLTKSTFTEVVNQVDMIALENKTTVPAKVNDLLAAPDLVRTGPESRAALIASDQTITRVGANTVFSFDSAGRNIHLEQGSILFHAPKGVGGGVIQSGGVTAAVLGTTILVSATKDGGFKVIVLEGRCKATLLKKSVTLRAGQIVIVLPGKTEFTPVREINLAQLVKDSLLVNGFSHPLASLPLIELAVKKQNSEIAAANATDNPGNQPASENGLDSGAYDVATHPPASPPIRPPENSFNVF